MLDQLTGWQITVLILFFSVMSIPWFYGLIRAIARAYGFYFKLVVELFGFEFVPEVREKRADGGVTEGDVCGKEGDSA